MTVIAFPGRRTPGSAPDLICRCGSHWFDLVRLTTDGQELPGSVLLNREGRIVGYSGQPRCHDCGQHL